MDLTRLTPAALQQRIVKDPNIKKNLDTIRRLKITIVALSILAVIGLATGIAAISVLGAPLVGGIILCASYAISKKAKGTYATYTTLQGVTNGLIEAKKKELQPDHAIITEQIKSLRRHVHAQDRSNSSCTIQ